MVTEVLDPLKVDGSRRYRKKLRATAIKQQGFELNPPRCLNCQHFSPPVHGVNLVNKKTSYRPPSCRLGKFAVKSSSICDKWLGTDGEKLE